MRAAIVRNSAEQFGFRSRNYGGHSQVLSMERGSPVPNYALSTSGSHREVPALQTAPLWSAFSITYVSGTAF